MFFFSNIRFLYYHIFIHVNSHSELQGNYIFGWDYLCRRLETVFIPLILRKISQILKMKKPPLIGKHTE
jgi:hypothetical protein